MEARRRISVLRHPKTKPNNSVQASRVCEGFPHLSQIQEGDGGKTHFCPAISENQANQHANAWLEIELTNILQSSLVGAIANIAAGHLTRKM